VATLTVNIPAGITTQPQNLTVTQGQSASFSVVASGSSPFGYQWNFNGTALSDATNASLALTNAQTTDAGSYTVVVTNAVGSITSQVATLTVLVPAGITTQPQNLTVTQGQTASFSVVASGSSPFGYQWNFNSAPVSGATNASLTLTNAQTTDAGSYTVVVNNPVGSITSQVATLTVLVPAGITTQPQNLTVTQGQSASFSVVASGSPPFGYQWNFNGASLSSATNASLTLTNAQTTDAGSYTVVVNNPVGSITSQVATLTVLVPAGITTQPQNLTVTQGQSASFSVVTSGSPPFGYQWNFNSAPVSGATNASLALTNAQTTDAGSYTVVVTNAVGSITSQVATLTVLVPAGITTQPQNLTVTQGQSASFSVVASGSSPFGYQWNFNGTALSDATNASLTLTNAQTTDAGSYTVVVTNAVGSITSQVATLTVLVPAGITTQPQNLTVTQGQSASFSVVASGSPPFGYQWSFNGTALSDATNASLALTNAQTTDAGSYTVVVTNAVGSITSQVATLTVLVPAGITTQPQNLTVTQGQSASFSVVASGSPPFGYQWNFNGTALSDATNSALTLTNAETIDAGSYTVVVNNPVGSITSQVATLTVLVPPGIQTQPQSQTVAAGQTASFSVVAGGTAPLAYQWNFNSAPVSGATNASLTLTNVQTTQAGSYTVVVTNNAGSITSAVAAMTVTNPVVSLSLSGGGGIPPNGFTFQVLVPTGLTYIILASTDLQVWTPIATNVATNGTILFTDTTATNYPNRFYQAVAQ
jgi:purine nucleoside phosphorylase